MITLLSGVSRGCTVRGWLGFLAMVCECLALPLLPLGAQTAAEAKGKYKLVRLGDAPLPATVTDNKGTWTVREGWIEIYANESWLFKVGITDPKGSKKTRADFGNVTRSGDTFTFQSAIYGTHPGTLGVSTMEFAYDVVGDSQPERLVFARPGQEAAALAAATPAAPSATTSNVPTVPAPSTAPPASVPPATAASGATPGPPVRTAPDSSIGNPVAMPNDAGPPPYDLAGAYTDDTPLRGATLEIGPDRSWQMHWTRPTSAPGFGGVFFSADHGSLSQSGRRVVLRSAEYGDFDALASGSATLVVDYYLGETLRRWRFVKNGVSEDAKNAPAPASSSATSTSPVKWMTVSAGAYHACALSVDGRAYCWGLSASPEGSAGGSRPQPVGGGLTFASLSAGSPMQCDPNRPEESCENNRAYHVCALTAAGEAYCWGVNRYGQLGNGTTNDTATPVLVGGGLTWSSVSSGEGTTCGITTAHAMFCWGRNDNGQLGIGSVDNQAHPTPQAVAQGVKAVSLGSNYTCALRDDGTSYCWGNGNSDRLGTSAAIGYGPNPSPLQVQSNNPYVAISAGRTHVCAVTASGLAECWGNNYYSEAGPGGPSRAARTPTPAGNISLTRIEVGKGFHSCGLAADGSAYCWGLNDEGRLGIGDAQPEPCGYEGRQGCSSVPVPVKGGLQFKSLSAGLEFTCGIANDGDAYCWGDNQRGQLGTGNRAHRSMPTHVAPPPP